MVDLGVDLCGLQLRNPVMTAAGPMSRNGKMLLAASNGGAGGLVAKTISIVPAEVPRPNMAVIDRRRNKGLLNVELWSEKSPEEWFEHEYGIARKAGIPLIGSVGYTPEEVRKLVPRMVSAGCQGIEFSTHYVRHIEEIPKAIRDATHGDVPIFAKLSPHRPEDLVRAAQAVERFVDGFTAINSFGPTLHLDIETGKPLLGGKDGVGWMSGPPLKPLAVRCIADVARVVKRPVIGVGGVATGTDAIELIMAGAHAVEVCTAAILNGHSIYGKIASEIENWLQDHDHDSIEDIRGLALSNLPSEPVSTKAVPPSIDRERCTNCGLCVKSCVYGALSMIATGPKDEVLHLSVETCAGCGLCTSVCPHRAIFFGS